MGLRVQFAPAARARARPRRVPRQACGGDTSLLPVSSGRRRPAAGARMARTSAAGPGRRCGAGRRPGRQPDAPRAAPASFPTPTSRPGPARQRPWWRRGSRPLTTHFLPRKVKRDSFSCGVSSRDPTLVTLRGGCCCWPELMVSPAGLGVQVRVVRRVGARSSPLSVTGAGGGESEAQHLAQLLRRGEEAEAAGRRSRRRAARSKGRSRLPPGWTRPDGRCPRTPATALNSQLLLQPFPGGGGGGRTIQHGSGGGRDHRTQDAGERAGTPLQTGSREEPPPRTRGPPRRAQAPPPSGRGAGCAVRCGAAVLGAGPASDVVPRLLRPGGCCRREKEAPLRRRAAGPSFPDVHLGEESVRTQAPSPERLRFLGRGRRTFTPRRKKVWNGETER